MLLKLPLGAGGFISKTPCISVMKADFKSRWSSMLSIKLNAQCSMTDSQCSINRLFHFLFFSAVEILLAIMAINSSVSL